MIFRARYKITTHPTEVYVGDGYVMEYTYRVERRKFFSLKWESVYYTYNHSYAEQVLNDAQHGNYEVVP